MGLWHPHAMAHVVRTATAPFTLSGTALEVHALPAQVDNYIWAVVDRAAGTALVIDGPESGPLLEFLAAHGLRLHTLLTTHVHPDHIGLHAALLAEGALAGVRVVASNAAPRPVPGANVVVDEGDRLEFAGIPIEVWRTEGHQNGHLSFVVPGAVFCGDTLFAGGCGYLFDGPPAAMHDSLQRLAGLPEATRVCCAHEYTEDNLRFALSVDPANPDLRARVKQVWALRKEGRGTVPSTVGEEKKTNPFLRVETAAIASALEAASGQAAPADGAARFAALRALKDRKVYRKFSDAELGIS